MAEPTNVLLENLKETLKGARWYFLSGSVTALFILLLAARGQLAVGAVEQEVKVPFLDLSAPTFGAALVALAVYILSGWMVFGGNISPPPNKPMHPTAHMVPQIAIIGVKMSERCVE
jgi:hypothetical protein